MRFFFIAVAETKFLDAVFEVVAEYGKLLWKRRSIRLGVMIRFSKWKGICKPCLLAEEYGVPLFVDNGAFDYLTRADLERPLLSEATLLKWIEDYARFARRYAKYCVALAMPDIPVHGRDFLPADVRLQRIVLTAKLHKRFARMLRREPDILQKFIVVIQGYTVGEYMLSWELNTSPDVYETQTFCTSSECEYGGVVGVGSVCVRKPSARGKTGVLASGVAAGTLAEFMREFLDARWPREIRGFHFFGLHTDAVRHFWSHKRYYGSDTGAHGLFYKFKWRTILGCKALDKVCYAKAVEKQIRITLGPLLEQTLEVFMDG